jgi:hypothetical protein
MAGSSPRGTPSRASISRPTGSSQALASKGGASSPQRPGKETVIKENRECYRKCMTRPLPREYGSFTSPRKSGGKSAFCRSECQQAYDDCVELERLRPQEFTGVEGVINWLRHHRTAALVGSIIVIAGVTFVVVSAGAGAVVLAPMVLMVSAEGPSGIPVAEASR